MKLPRPTLLRVLIVVGIAVIGLVQSGSSTYQRYLRCQVRVNDFELSEEVCRRRASVCEELAPKLREVAALAREVAKSASSEFERSKWLEMARSDEEKANKLDHEALQMMTQADGMASRANKFSRAAWRPWVDEPE